MAGGTNGHAAKAALIALLQAETGTGEGLEGVAISFTYVGKLADSYREYIYGGKVESPIDILTMGGSVASRDEKPLINLHIRVTKLDGLTADARALACSARVVALGAVVEQVVIANPTLGVSGVLNTRVVGYDLDGATDDEASWATLDYQIEVESCLTGA